MSHASVSYGGKEAEAGEEGRGKGEAIALRRGELVQGEAEVGGADQGRLHESAPGLLRRRPGGRPRLDNEAAWRLRSKGKAHGVLSGFNWQRLNFPTAAEKAFAKGENECKKA